LAAWKRRKLADKLAFVNAAASRDKKDQSVLRETPLCRWVHRKRARPKPEDCVFINIPSHEAILQDPQIPKRQKSVTLAVYALLCELGSDSRRDDFRPDMKFLGINGQLSETRVQAALATLARLGIVKMDGDRVSIAQPTDEEKRNILKLTPRADHNT
jgi:hypothetical protein